VKGAGEALVPKGPGHLLEIRNRIVIEAGAFKADFRLQTVIQKDPEQIRVQPFEGGVDEQPGRQVRIAPVRRG
jgi:hypothetical protein